jgi:hypothetical protein
MKNLINIAKIGNGAGAKLTDCVVS